LKFEEDRHQNLQSSNAFTEADLGAAYNKANYPKYSPGPIVFV